MPDAALYLIATAPSNSSLMMIHCLIQPSPVMSSQPLWLTRAHAIRAVLDCQRPLALNGPGAIALVLGIVAGEVAVLDKPQHLVAAAVVDAFVLAHVTFCAGTVSRVRAPLARLETILGRGK